MSLALVLCCHQHALGRHQEQRNQELKQVRLGGGAGQARRGARRRVPDDVRRLDAQMGESRERLAVVVRASRTTLTGIFGVGPVIAVTVLDNVADASWFASRGPLRRLQRHAPVEVSCGNRQACGLSGASNTPSAWAAIAPPRLPHPVTPRETPRTRDLRPSASGGTGLTAVGNTVSGRRDRTSPDLAAAGASPSGNEQSGHRNRPPRPRRLPAWLPDRHSAAARSAGEITWQPPELPELRRGRKSADCVVAGHASTHRRSPACR